MASWGIKNAATYACGDTITITKIAWLPIVCDDKRKYWLESVVYTYKVNSEDALEMEGFTSGEVPHYSHCDSYEKFAWELVSLLPLRTPK